MAPLILGPPAIHPPPPQPPPPPPRSFSENFAVTYLATSNPCLDFLFHVVPDTLHSQIHDRLDEAWAHDPLTTLKLICHLRGVRGTGKSDKEGFYAASFWLYQNHPKTLARNVPSIADFGYFKDLPEVLLRVLEDNGGYRGVRSPEMPEAIRRLRGEERATAEKNKIEKAKKVVAKHGGDSDFRLLYERISDHFNECLIADMDLFRSGEIRQISLAAKWCPSIDSSFDRSTLLCESIARKIFTRESFPEYMNVEEEHYAYRIDMSLF